MKSCCAVLLIAASCSSSSAPPRAPATSSGRALHFRIGALDAYALEDGVITLPNDGQVFGVDQPPRELAALLASAGLPGDSIRLDLQCLLVEAGDRVILFDTGMGDAAADPAATTGRLLRSLAQAGVAPAAVTDVFISHAHSDHLGGLVTRAGALAFPSATIHMSAPEWAALQADPDADSARYVAAITARVASFEPGAQVLPVVKAVATPGHTPGHSSYEIGTGADTLFYSGDVVHHAVISLQRPAWSVQVDSDHAAAAATRQQTLARLAADHTRVFVPHFPFPGLGHIVVDGPAFGWQPEPR